jgi:hypothetical protein
MGLDRFQPARCTMDSQCADLERVQPTGDACRTWQCNNPAGTDGVCEIRVRDDDEDGSPAAMCAMGVMADCDDMDATRSATLPEACNLIDDDCDGTVDPRFGASSGTIAALGTSAGVVSLTAVGTSDLAIGRVPPRGMTALPSTATVPLGSTRMATLTEPVAGGRCRDEVAPFGVVDNPDCLDASDGSGAYVPLGGPEGLFVYDPIASAQECGAPSTVQVAWVGAPMATSPVRVCLDDTRLASPTLTREPAGDVLLVWVDDTGVRACGSMTPASAPVRARVLRTRAATSTPPIAASEVLELGTTADALGPSVAFVPGQGWVVAHVEGADVIVTRIEVSNDITAYEATRISTLAAAGASQVTVTPGPGSSIALAYLDGPCDSRTNRVVVRIGDVGAGSVVFGEAWVANDEAVTAQRGAPVASYGAGRGEWAVLYREGSRVVAARLDRRGTLVGTRVPLLMNSVAARPLVIELPGDPTRMLQPRWAFAAVTEDGDIASGVLACLDPGT